MPCKWAALSIGPCWGTWGGSFTGTFEKKRECISGFQYIKQGRQTAMQKLQRNIITMHRVYDINYGY